MVRRPVRPGSESIQHEFVFVLLGRSISDMVCGRLLLSLIPTPMVHGQTFIEDVRDHVFVSIDRLLNPP